MPPRPERLKDDLIQRTVLNLQQAKGMQRISVPVAQILGQQQNHNAQVPPDLISFSDPSEPRDSPRPPDMSTNPPTLDPHSHRIPGTHPPPAPTRAQLTTSLIASTALVQNLRLRNSIQAADLQRTHASIETRRASVLAKLQVEGEKKARWRRTSWASLGLWVFYVGWCWVNSVEFEYVRRRRMDVLGML